MAIITTPNSYPGLGGPTSNSLMQDLINDTSLTRIFRGRTGDVTQVGSTGAYSATTTSNTMTVTALAAGSITAGSVVTLAGVPAGTLVTAQQSGTSGGAGVYTLSRVVTTAQSSAVTGGCAPSTTSMTDLKGSGASMTSDSNSNPALRAGVIQGYSIAQQAAASPVINPAQFEALDFEAANFDSMAMSGALQDFTAAYTIMCVWKPVGVPPSSMFIAGPSCGYFRMSSGSLSWQYNGSSFVLSGAVLDGSMPNVCIAAYDGVGSYYHRINGVAQVNAKGAQTTAATSVRLGNSAAGATNPGPMTGYVRDFMIASANLLDGVAAHTATLAKLQTYCSKVYGLVA